MAVVAVAAVVARVSWGHEVIGKGIPQEQEEGRAGLGGVWGGAGRAPVPGCASQGGHE